MKKLIAPLAVAVLVVLWESNVDVRIGKKDAKEEMLTAGRISALKSDGIKEGLQEECLKFLEEPKVEWPNDYLKSRTEKALRPKNKPVFYNTWMNAVVVDALLNDGKEQKYLPRVKHFLDVFIKSDGTITENVSSLEHCVLGSSLLKLEQSGNQKNYGVLADSMADYLLNKHVRTSTGTLPYFGKTTTNLVLVDSLGMICPFLTEYGIRRSNPKAIELAGRQLEEYLSKGMDENLNMPYHAYDLEKKRHLGMVGWTRGMGWLLVGMVDSLKALREAGQDNPLLATKIPLLLGTTFSEQRQNGLFGWELVNPYCDIDTSGSAMILYSLERAMQMNLVSGDYVSKAEKLMVGLMENTTVKFEVINSLADCQGIGHFPRVFGHFSYGQAFATSAYIEYNKRVSSLKDSSQ